MSNRTFRKFVIIFVTLIGTGFGTWAGFGYSLVYFWIAGLLGIVSGYILARLYLNLLAKASGKGCSNPKILLLGTITGTVCGLLSTAFIHGIMLLINLITKWQDFAGGEGGIELAIAVLIGCHVVGALTGLVAGGVCSSVYVCKVMKNEQ